jgi:hypothetical protein
LEFIRNAIGRKDYDRIGRKHDDQPAGRLDLFRFARSRQFGRRAVQPWFLEHWWRHKHRQQLRPERVPVSWLYVTFRRMEFGRQFVTPILSAIWRFGASLFRP